ncbi:MAG: sensor domain-containing diguanylate cyclase [Bordetella sp.]|nr:sensor domain-containing diguanylate cyclase [Bordetella sp.]
MDPILSQLATALPEAKSIEALTRPLLQMLSTVTGMESTYLTSIDLDRDEQKVRFARNVGDLTIPEGLTVKWSDTLCKRAIDEDRLYTDDVASCWGDSEAARQLGIQTYLSTPILNDDGKLLGTLCAASSGKRQLAPDANALLKLFSNLVASFIERERLLDNLQQANANLMAYAMTDTLTGLPNRRAVFEELERLLKRAERAGGTVLVGVIDLDGFKMINDTYGHQCGDEFLQAVGRRLAESLRASDMVGRVGGDEFLLVGPGPTPDPELDDLGASDTQLAAQTLQLRTAAATAGTYRLGDRVIEYPGASVGVVSVDPLNMDAETSVRLADTRMYEIKRTRKHLNG